MRISIFGLGYVGAVSAACLARDGHQIIGVDVDENKLRLIESGRAPIVEEGIQSLMKEAIDSGRLSVTDDAMVAIQQSDISFVCVGTPSQPNGGQDQTALFRVAEQIGKGLASVEHFHAVVMRSTVEPGTVDGELRRLLELHSGKRSDVDFGLCFQPEFLREGSSIRDYDHPPFTVVGTNSNQSAAMLESVFGHLPGDYIVSDIGSAEMLKYACNCFHAVKVTFSNEMGRIAQGLGVDSNSVMKLVCRDTQLNISPAYLRPGFAFGGSCLPKDLRALMYLAKTKDVEAPMLGNVLASNQTHVERAVNLVLESGARKVGLIGLSFKGGTDDLRESPLVTMAERFIGKGLELRIYDPEVNLSVLIGANRRYIEEHIPHIAALLTPDCADVVGDAEAVVVGIALPEAVEALSNQTREDQYILDLVGIEASDQLKGRYQGICW